MHVPSWLLLIPISYLTGRSMILTYNGATSSREICQAVLLKVLSWGSSFLMSNTMMHLSSQIPRILMNTECKLRRSKCSNEHCKKHAKDIHAVYIDDLSELEAIELKKQLMKDPVQRPFPLNYHERTQHIFPTENSRLQAQLTKVESFSVTNQMKINEAKSKGHDFQ